MKLVYRILIAAVLAVVPVQTQAAEVAAAEAHAKSYHTAGKAVVEMVINKKVDAAEVAKKVDVMVVEAVWFCKEYAKSKPNGDKLLKVVVDNVEAMKKLTFKELEHEWHDLHYFDSRTAEIGLNLKDEEHEHFTDPIHSLVHPLLVLKAAQAYTTSKSEEDLKSMKEEITEGLEQMEKQKAVLTK